MSEFLSWDQEISQEGQESKGAIVHKAGEYNFKVTEFKKDNVNNPDSDYHKAYLAKLTLNVEGAKVFENLILHKNLDWKIGALFRSLGLMSFPPAERWQKLLGSTGRVKVKVEKYMKEGQEKEKNVVEYYLDKVPNTDFPPAEQAPAQAEKMPWE